MIDVIAPVAERATELIIGQSLNWKEFVSD